MTEHVILFFSAVIELYLLDMQRYHLDTLPYLDNPANYLFIQSLIIHLLVI
jgi:hypothetical protein